MAETKGNKRRSALIIVLFFMAVVITAVFGYKAFANPAKPETTPSQTAEDRKTDTAVDPNEEPPTVTIPPTETSITPTGTVTPTPMAADTTPQNTRKINPTLFIYHTP